MTSTVEQQLPHLAQTVHQTGHAIKKELSDMDTKLHSHHAYSKDQLGHINQVGINSLDYYPLFLTGATIPIGFAWTLRSCLRESRSYYLCCR